MAIDAGDVVLVPFPYRDRQGERTRPAVVVSAQSYDQRVDLVVVAVTSHPARFSTDHELQDWHAAGLQHSSTVRMLIGTVSVKRVVKQIGRLSDRDWTEVRIRVTQVFA